jgi:hypothetical protein
MIDDTTATPVLVGELVEHDAPAAPVPRKGGQFVKGDPRINKKGRIHKTKNKLRGNFLRDLTKWHARWGYSAIERVGRDNPVALLQMIANILPREDKIDVEHTGAVAVGVVDLQDIKQRTRELFARIGNTVDSGSGED